MPALTIGLEDWLPTMLLLASIWPLATDCHTQHVIDLASHPVGVHDLRHPRHRRRKGGHPIGRVLGRLDRNEYDQADAHEVRLHQRDPARDDASLLHLLNALPNRRWLTSRLGRPNSPSAPSHPAAARPAACGRSHPSRPNSSIVLDCTDHVAVQGARANAVVAERARAVVSAAVKSGPSPALGIEVVDVSHAFVIDGKPLSVLDQVTLSVSPGEFVAILDPSECGKSTLLPLGQGCWRISAPCPLSWSRW